MNYVFIGFNFLFIVLKIVEGDIFFFFERYLRELNVIMERYGNRYRVIEIILNGIYIFVYLKKNFFFKFYSMLNKNLLLRLFVIEILKIFYIEE